MTRAWFFCHTGLANTIRFILISDVSQNWRLKAITDQWKQVESFSILAILNEKFRGWVLSRRTVNTWQCTVWTSTLSDFYFWAVAQNQVFKEKTNCIDRVWKVSPKNTAQRQSMVLGRMSSRARRSAWKLEMPFSASFVHLCSFPLVFRLINIC